MKKKTFAVIGLGSFGRSIADQLLLLNADVLLIDGSERKIAAFADRASNAVICDATDEKALIDAGIKSVDHAIVCIGNDIQASILCSLILKDLNIPIITVKAQNEYHQKVVERLGVTEVLRPETEMGRRLAKRIIRDTIIEIFELTSDYSYAEVTLPPSFVGKTIMDLNVRQSYNVNIVAVRRGEEIIIPDPLQPFEEKDQLLLVGTNAAISKL
jgi:trk system potassium uptake protein TrkA